MNAIITQREVVCSSCGDGLGEFSATERVRVGPCCENLPPLWDQDSEGLYTRAGGDNAGGPQCSDCGATRFLIRFTERTRCTINSVPPEPDDTHVYFDLGYVERSDPDEQHHQVECANCGHVGDTPWDWA